MLGAVLEAGCGGEAPASQAGVGADLPPSPARRFYERRGWRAAWDPDQARRLGQAIAQAQAHGLDPRSFAVQPAPDDAARQDVAQTQAALAYGKALASGAVDPRKVATPFTLVGPTVDLAAGLEQAMAQGDVGAWLASLPPQDPEYQVLSASYVAALGQPGGTASPAARQLAANLERRRWLTRTPPATRIDVNTAGAFLAYIQPDTAPWKARTVTGRDDHPTPCIEASFRRLTANPPWKVPKEIAAKEIFPKGRGYMRREHMRVVGDSVEQQPGPRCALGLVKFDVADPYDIYLHDTPAKGLFSADERHRSHGCVRVQRALELARLLAGQSDQGDAFEAALASRDTSEVELGSPIPVRLLYHTAYPSPRGGVLLARDVYGWDDALASQLGFGQPAVLAPDQTPDPDYGP